MKLVPVNSLKDLISPRDMVAEAAKEICSACANSSDSIQLEEAITALQRKFASSSEFRAAISDSSFEPPAGVDFQTLCHFAGKWSEHEKVRQRVGAERQGVGEDLDGILIYRGGASRNKKPLTPAEIQKVRERKRQRKS